MMIYNKFDNRMTLEGNYPRVIGLGRRDHRRKRFEAKVLDVGLVSRTL